MYNINDNLKVKVNIILNNKPKSSRYFTIDLVLIVESNNLLKYFFINIIISSST